VGDNPTGTQRTDDTELGERIALLTTIEIQPRRHAAFRPPLTPRVHASRAIFILRATLLKSWTLINGGDLKRESSQCYDDSSR
jgi:hypothetical protein